MRSKSENARRRVTCRPPPKPQIRPRVAPRHGSARLADSASDGAALVSSSHGRFATRGVTTRGRPWRRSRNHPQPSATIRRWLQPSATTHPPPRPAAVSARTASSTTCDRSWWLSRAYASRASATSGARYTWSRRTSRPPSRSMSFPGALRARARRGAEPSATICGWFATIRRRPFSRRMNASSRARWGVGRRVEGAAGGRRGATGGGSWGHYAPASAAGEGRQPEQLLELVGQAPHLAGGNARRVVRRRAAPRGDGLG